MAPSPLAIPPLNGLRRIGLRLRLLRILRRFQLRSVASGFPPRSREQILPLFRRFLPRSSLVHAYRIFLDIGVLIDQNIPYMGGVACITYNILYVVRCLMFGRDFYLILKIVVRVAQALIGLFEAEPVDKES